MYKTYRLSNKVVLALLSIALVLAGCSNNGNGNTASPKPAATDTASTEPSTSPTTTPQSGGELTFALAGSPDSLDIGVVAGDIDFRVGRNIFDSLVGELPDHTIKPWLAESWEISSDSMSYTFKLRKDVKFHDGTPFNAAAVKVNFDRITDANSQSVFAKQLLGPYASSEVVDEYTIKINLSDVFTPLLGNLAKSTLGIQSPESFTKYGDKVGQNPVGTGPFKFVSWAPNSEIILEKSADYNWASPAASHNGPAYVDKVVFKLVSEEATRVNSLQSQQVLVAESIPAQNLVALQSDSNFNVQQAIAPGGTYALVFNNQKAPWTDVKLRQAVQLAIDVDTIVKTLYFGTFPRAWSPLSSTTLGYDASLENSYKVDLDQANKLLDEAGWVKGDDGIRVKDGKPLTLTYADTNGNREKREDIIKIVQQQLKEVGIKVVLNITAVGPFLDALKAGTYDLSGESFAAGDPDVLRTLFSKKNWATAEYPNSNMAFFADDQVEQWLVDGFQEQNVTKRTEIYKQIQQFIVQNAATIPVYEFPYSIASSKRVSGITFDSPGYPLLYDVSISQ